MRTFELSPAVRVRLAERDLRQELGRYLDVLRSTREQDVRNMVISTTGNGERRLFVSYISEVPIWKSSYRLVIPKSGRPLLQGWAIVDNTIGEDWRNVELSLVAGAPQSFVQQDLAAVLRTASSGAAATKRVHGAADTWGDAGERDHACRRLGSGSEWFGYSRRNGATHWSRRRDCAHGQRPKRQVCPPGA